MIDKLRAKFPELQSETPGYGSSGDCEGIHTAPAAQAPAISEFFRGEGWHLEFLTCLDNRAEHGQFRIVYQYNCFGAPHRHRVNCDIAAGGEQPSIAGLFEAANWYEREVYDMFGVRFSGHPFMERILTEEGCDYHPLLKDFVAHNQYSDSSGAAHD